MADLFDIVVARKLSGGGGGGGSSDIVLVHMDADTMVLDKTWQEIHDALADNIIVVVNSSSFVVPMVIAKTFDDGHGTYSVYVYTDYQSTTVSEMFFADSADGYPYYD